MKFIYGLSVTGESIIKYYNKLNINVFAWDDDIKRRNRIKNKYKNVKLIEPLKIEWNNIQEAFISSGISLYKKELLFSKNKKKLFRDLELYSRISKNKQIISVTGTNGKSTTVKLISDLFSKNKINFFLGGNFGTPLMDFKNNKIISKKHIIELSSFQLESAPSFKSHVSVLLNISKDHLEKYKNFKDYIRAKEKIFYSRNFSYGIIILDDDHCKKIYKNFVNKNLIPLSTTDEIKKGVYFKNNIIYDNYFSKRRFEINNVSKALLGSFNKQNILICYVISKIYNIKENVFLKVIQEYKGLPHRQQFIFKNNKYCFINNSKATNIESTIRSVENFNNVLLILGGRIKENNFKKLKKVNKNIKKCFIIGESTDLIYQNISNFINCEKNYKLEKAVSRVFTVLQNSHSMTNVILAPACSSYDQFSNFQERGNKFIELVKTKINKL